MKIFQSGSSMLLKILQIWKKYFHSTHLLGTRKPDFQLPEPITILQYVDTNNLEHSGASLKLELSYFNNIISVPFSKTLTIFWTILQKKGIFFIPGPESLMLELLVNFAMYINFQKMNAVFHHKRLRGIASHLLRRLNFGICWNWNIWRMTFW